MKIGVRGQCLMGRSLRFKINKSHQIMKDAINRLNEAKKQANSNGDFQFSGGSTLFKSIDEDIPNYGYVKYKVINNTFKDGASLKKPNATLIAHSKVTDENSPLKNYFTVLKPRKHRIYRNKLLVGSPRNIGTEYGEEFGLGRSGGAWSRDTDTETLLLEELSNRFDKKTVAEVTLFTYLEPCLSCDMTIVKFLEDFPMVTLNIYFYKEKNNCVIGG